MNSYPSSPSPLSSQTMAALVTKSLLAGVLLLTSACASSSSNTADDNGQKDEKPEEIVTTSFSLPEVDCAAAEVNEAAILAAAEGPHRTAKNRARNEFRHPAKTLAFFEVKPSSKVLELWPGGGWYTEVLAPYLRQCGELHVTNFDPNGPDEYPYTVGKRFDAKLKSAPAIYEFVQPHLVNPPEIATFVPAESVDVVVTFRNNHGWIRDGYHDKIYAAAFAALKPGGVLGVVQHRGPEGFSPEEAGKTGYVDEAVVIAAAEDAGFVLEEKSEINANPKDTKDYEKGVWTLPPALRLEDTDRAKYEAIGESDRMTLRFRKPAAATTEAAAESEE